MNRHQKTDKTYKKALNNNNIRMGISDLEYLMSLKERGIIAELSCPKGDSVNIYTLPLHFKKVLKGSNGGSLVPDVEISRFIRLMKQRK